MQIVIDVPNWLYNAMLEHKEPIYSQSLAEAVRDGTPLPKGHGDLKDADKLKHAFIKWSMVVQGSFTDYDIASIVCNSPTIIEADKAEESEVEDDT